MHRIATRGHATSLDYCPFPIDTDPLKFGLTTSSVNTRAGTVVVRHGRRTASDTATILLHGGAGSWTTWTPLLSAGDYRAVDHRAVDHNAANHSAVDHNAADHNAANYSAASSAEYPTLTDLVIPDLPGWGDTAQPADEESLTVEALANTVAEIARSLGYQHWIVIGHSLGGSVALQLASAEIRATTFVGLVSASTFSVIESVRHPLTRFTVLPAYTALLQIMKALGVFERAGRGLIRGIARMALLRPLVAPLFSHPLRIDASVISTLASGVRPRAFTVASARASGYDADLAWSRIECPVRATHGDSDVFVAAMDDERLRVVIRDFEVRAIFGTGHFGHVERPYETLRALLGPSPSEQ